MVTAFKSRRQRQRQRRPRSHKTCLGPWLTLARALAARPHGNAARPQMGNVCYCNCSSALPVSRRNGPKPRDGRWVEQFKCRHHFLSYNISLNGTEINRFVQFVFVCLRSLVFWLDWEINISNKYILYMKYAWNIYQLNKEILRQV